MKTNHAVKNMTVHLDKPTLELMKLYPEVNWSNVARTGILDYIDKRQLGEKLIDKRNQLRNISSIKDSTEEIESQVEENKIVS